MTYRFRSTRVCRTTYIEEDRVPHSLRVLGPRARDGLHDSKQQELWVVERHFSRNLTQSFIQHKLHVPASQTANPQCAKIERDNEDRIGAARSVSVSRAGPRATQTNFQRSLKTENHHRKSDAISEHLRAKNPKVKEVRAKSLLWNTLLISPFGSKLCGVTLLTP